MAYIGKSPIIGNFVKLDAITAVNGQAAYTMQNGGANFTDYETVNQFLVSLNGTIQAPTDSFTVSGSTLTFASNLSTGDVIDFVIIFGNSLSAGTPTDATVTTAKLADSAVTAAKITDSTITAAKLASGTVQNQSAFKNIIINGDMQQAQRANSTSSISSNGYHTVDRWQTNLSTAAGVWTQSQDTTVPSGQGFARSLKMDCTTADGSLAAGDRLIIQQAIEGQMLQYLKKGTSSAESLTVSFWVYATKTGTNIIELYDNDNTRQISQSYTISSSNTWEKKTLTFAGDTTGAFGNDANASLYLNFYFAAGSTYSSGTLNTSWGSVTSANRAVGQVNHADSTSNNFYITGIQMEAGTSASDFEFTPFDISRDRCKRYFYKTTGNQWLFPLSTNNNNTRSQVVFRPSMRATPTSTVSFSNTGTGSGTQFENVNHVTVYVNGLSSSGDTALQSGATFDAEL